MWFINWFDSKIRKMNWLDYALTKLSVFLFTLLLIRVWGNFRAFILGIEWYWFLILALVAAAPIFKKISTN